MALETAYIAFGANLDPEKNIEAALNQLATAVRVYAISTVVRTPAVARPEQPDYLNGVVAIETAAFPRALKFSVLRGIEQALGRVRSAVKDAPRPIDLDLLLYGRRCVAEEGLVLPDPDIRRRAFVAGPLLELAPDLTLPDTGEALRAIVDEKEVQALCPEMALTQRLRTNLLA